MTDPSASSVPADWFRHSFGGDYLRVYRKRNEAAAAVEAAFCATVLGLAPGDRVLDLACGAGRHAAPLAAAGLSVVGLDLSLDLLTEARGRLGSAVPVVRGDMRHLPFANRSFRALASFFTSFGYFTRLGDDARVLGEMARVVAPGGGMLLDLPDREATIGGLVPQSERTEGELQIFERRWISGDGARVEKEIRVVSGSKTEPTEERYHESVRLYRSAEINALLSAAGWLVEARFGNFEGDPWESGVGPRMINVLKRRA